MKLSKFFPILFITLVMSQYSAASRIIIYEATATVANLHSRPIDAKADSVTLSLYDFLYYNYGHKVITCSMSQPVWDNNMATDVHRKTDRWPVMNCYDLMHLCYSPCDWIDYGDITPVREWHRQGGAVTLMWHWQVPKYQGSTEFTSTADMTSFIPQNILTEGSWEHQLFYTDLYEAYTVIKKLQDAGIPVIWRPFHEASGNTSTGGGAWFWWGKSGADVFKDLWHRMYEYFRDGGIHNLIWVWTSCDYDGDWYPGDEYVDIVSTDIYNKSVADVSVRFDELRRRYPTRIVTLSECGHVPNVSQQKENGILWSWTMPWYGNCDDGTPWVSDSWWADAVASYDPGCDISIPATGLTDVEVGDTIHVCVTALGIGGEPKAVFQTPQYEDIPGTIQWPVITGDYELNVTAENVDIIRQGMLVRGMNYVISRVELRKVNVPSFLRGDANGDGEIGMADVTCIVNYILGSPDDTFNAEAADANEDGEVGMPDVMFVVQYILNGSFPDKP